MKNIMGWYAKKNIFIRLLPFLILNILICLARTPNEFVGDEGRYIKYAENILNGFISEPFPNVELWSGRGYSLIILPFVAVKIPYIFIRLLNPIFIYLSLIFTYYTLKNYFPNKKIVFYILILGSYIPVIWKSVPYILTECFTWLLVSIISFLMMKTFQKKQFQWKYFVITSFSIAFLAMTKVIFGYVIFALFILSFIVFLFSRNQQVKKTFYIFSFSFLFCLPWLFYTYHLTDKIFYWSDAGGIVLYSLSSPYQQDLGDWIPLHKAELYPHHKTFIDSVNQFNTIKRDEILYKKAQENIKNYPKKFMKNWVANLGRLLFSYPFSNSPQKISTYPNIIFNIPYVFCIVIALGIALLNSKKIPPELIILFLFFTIYLFASSLVSTYNRMFYITLPFWTIFIAYIFNRFVSLKISMPNKNISLL